MGLSLRGSGFPEMDQLLWAVPAQCLSDLTAIHVSSYPLTHLSFMTLSFPCSPLFTKRCLILLQIQKQTGLSHLNPYYHRISCVNILCAASQFVGLLFEWMCCCSPAFWKKWDLFYFFSSQEICFLHHLCLAQPRSHGYHSHYTKRSNLHY